MAATRTNNLPPGAPKRRHPRVELSVPVKLSLPRDKKRWFEATLPTSNISVGGLFLQSTFFLKPGVELDVALTLPASSKSKREITVRARGTVVRVETADSDSDEVRTGFAIKFTQYAENSRMELASFFLGPVLRDFLDDYFRARKIRPTQATVTQMVDVLAAWELRREEGAGASAD